MGAIRHFNSKEMRVMSAIAQLEVRAEDAAQSSQTEQQIRDAHKMEAIGRLVGGVAHDFNNLLTGMVLSSELILAGLEPNSRLRRFAEEIRKAGEQGAGLIHQLMAVARQRAVEPCLLSLNDLVSEIGTLLTRLIGEDIELIPELADDLGVVRMDPAQVQQIILNLVLNARDAMPTGGRIIVSTSNCDGPKLSPEAHNQFCDSWVALAVSDTGCGIGPETRARLFANHHLSRSAPHRAPPDRLKWRAKPEGARESLCIFPEWESDANPPKLPTLLIIPARSRITSSVGPEKARP